MKRQLRPEVKEVVREMHDSFTRISGPVAVVSLLLLLDHFLGKTVAICASAAVALIYLFIKATEPKP